MENAEAGTDGCLAVPIQVISKTDARLQQFPTVAIELSAGAGAYRGEAEIARSRKGGGGIP